MPSRVACVCAHTIYKSLEALHQVFDRFGQVPRVLLDILLNNATAAKSPILCLAKFCQHFKNSESEE